MSDIKITASEMNNEYVDLFRKGEYGQNIEIDISYYTEKYGAVNTQVTFISPADGKEYPVVSEQDGDVVNVEVSAFMTNTEGYGQLRLYFYTDAKLDLSATVKLYIRDGKGERMEETEVVKDWLDKSQERLNEFVTEGNRIIESATEKESSVSEMLEEVREKHL